MHNPLHNPVLGELPPPKPTLLTRIAIGGLVAGGAIILAPHVLPALGVGSEAMASESMFVLHTSAESGGSGLAGAINHILAAVPVVGEKLAEGGLINVLTTGVIGIGGVMLARSISHGEHGKEGIHWGKVVQYAALATSALIALPTVLTALGSGLIYMSTLMSGAEFSNDVIAAVDKTLGTVGGNGQHMMGLSGVPAIVAHALTCGMAMVPAAMTLTLPDADAKNYAARLQPVRAEEPQKYSDGSLRLEMQVNAPTSKDVPCDVLLHLTHTDTGRPLTVDELAVTHTEKMHLFVVDQGLKDYQHIHPQPTGEPGVFAFSFTPNTNNAYGAWADITTAYDGQSHKLRTAFPAAAARDIKPVIRTNSASEADGLFYTWEAEPLQQGKPAIVNVHVTHADGSPVHDLEPVMGAFAHLVGFSADGKSIIHCHPLGEEPRMANDRGGPHLHFHVEPDAAGPTQFYLQVRRQDEDIFVPFGQQVKSPQLAAARFQTAVVWPEARGV